MTPLLAGHVAEVVTAAARLLEKRMGAKVRLTDPVELGGSGRTMVLRVRVSENAYSLPRTVILKQVKQSDRVRRDFGHWEPGVDSASSAFLREAVSYQFATALPKADRPGPQLLAYDLKKQLLILSDLGDNAPLAALLAEGEPTSGHSLMALAQALGRMHAATVGREPDFTALAARAGVPGQGRGIAHQADAAVARIPAMLADTLGVTVPDAVAEVARHGADLFHGGRFRAFSPSDLCPDNLIVNADGVRFLDYEWAGFRDATLDIAYVLTAFPGCLCTHDISLARARDMADAWRAEVVGIWPALGDDEVLAAKIVEAELIWIWLTTYWFLPDDERRLAAVREHTLAVPRSRAVITRWSTLAATSEATGCADIADFAGQVIVALETAWAT
ncbi:phosphotransferase [Skermania sp. ID1734]|uniref:phosphotransferase family protein n=1 Tax=Skermania sp. ID1734 TaxID=2597516 RepID=UPI0011806DAD|nr:phosphotransferase [Skermania sp. ID1734]TSD94644.1 phosphotransferase [Skermania sp. ID1734]